MSADVVAIMDSPQLVALLGSLSTLTFKQSVSKSGFTHRGGFTAFTNLRQPSAKTAAVSVNKFEPSRDFGSARVARKMNTPINQA
jgi:hypothetical protein